MIDYSLAGSSIEHLFCHEANQRGFRTYKPNEDGSTKDIILQNDDGVLVSVQIKKKRRILTIKNMSQANIKNIMVLIILMFMPCVYLKLIRHPNGCFLVFLKSSHHSRQSQKLKKLNQLSLIIGRFLMMLLVMQSHAESCRVWKVKETKGSLWKG